MAKVVIDANVIISAAFGGKPLEAVVRALEDHEVYLSLTIKRELQEVISGLSKKLTKEQIQPMWFYQGMPRMTIIFRYVKRQKPIF
jgi:predicted nucleic acid-binding protein